MNSSCLRELHAAAGARFAPGDPSGLPLTYGDVPAEYRAGREGCLLLDETCRGLVRVTGPDAADFLHRILATRTRGLEPGQGSRALLLTSKGKVQHLFELLAEEGGFLFSTPPGDAPALMASLDRYHFGEALQLSDSTETHAPLALLGPGADALVARVAGDLPALPRGSGLRREFQGAPLQLWRTGVAGSLGWRLDAGPERAAALWQTLLDGGATPGGRVACDILRIEALQAEAFADVDDNIYPQEARLEDAFQLDKGCYIGQEVVAKIDTYGGLNKRLVSLAIDHDDPLPRGTKLVAFDPERNEERELGLITSWSYSFVLDRGLALGYVKRRHQAPGRQFELRTPDGTPLPGQATLTPGPTRPDGLPVTGDFEPAPSPP